MNLSSDFDIPYLSARGTNEHQSDNRRAPDNIIALSRIMRFNIIMQYLLYNNFEQVLSKLKIPKYSLFFPNGSIPWKTCACFQLISSIFIEKRKDPVARDGDGY